MEKLLDKKLFFISIALIMTFSFSVYAETLRVVTQDNVIREDCNFVSRVKAKVKYNDQLEVISKDADWYRVKIHNIKGCIHKTAVTEKQVSLSGSGLFGSQSHTASKDEVALAGKGFNPEVEASFKNKHPELDFAIVDKIETYKVSEDNLRKFIKSGGLNQP